VSADQDPHRDFGYPAGHDPLTGLANAQLFADELRTVATDEVDRDALPGVGTAALLIDLDDFKIVNDTYGREVADQVLTEVARRIESCLGPSDLAAHFGGDDFAVLLRDVTDVTAPLETTQGIADALARPAAVNSHIVDCQASIGVAYAEGRDQLESLLREADTALYTAKTLGKGHWRQFHEGMLAPTRRLIDERRRLDDALRSSALTLHYQPIVEVATGYAAGFEALLRLDADPPMSPHEVIQAAEDTGLIIAIGDWVLRQALVAVARLNESDGVIGRYVSVNVSARQLRQPDFVDTLRAHLMDTGADPSLLILEITENLLVGGDDRAWEFLADLRHDGIRVAIDDYGTGYASLSYLRQPTIDIVKLDQSFLSDPISLRGRTLLQAITRLCHELELEQVAEGVHDLASRDALLEAGCRYGQGFLYSEAMPLAQAINWRRA
jgi:diguanylate cyclase (GGDEF)-like protein